MVRSFKTEGIVIKRVNFGEADKLVTLFTKNHGKIVVVAKGIRKINSKKAPHLELFSHTIISLSQGRNFDIITESETLTSFGYLHKELIRLAFGFRILEVVERLLPERQVHRDIFGLLWQFLIKLNEKKRTDFRVLSEQFLLEILWRLGYLPKEKILMDASLYRFLEEVMEKKLKSDVLLMKVYN